MRAKIKGGQLVFTKNPTRRRSSYFSWWWLGGLFLVLFLATVLGLRSNNLNMINLRNQLVAADKTGEINQVKQAALSLQHYVAHHMNTATGKVALVTMYNQAAQQALEEIRPSEIDESVYNKAAQSCQSVLRDYGYEAWANCVADKVGINNGATKQIATDVAPDPALFYVEYMPASLSFDLAGVTLLISLGLLLVIVGRLISILIKKLLFKGQ